MRGNPHGPAGDAARSGTPWKRWLHPFVCQRCSPPPPQATACAPSETRSSPRASPACGTARWRASRPSRSRGRDLQTRRVVSTSPYPSPRCSGGYQDPDLCRSLTASRYSPTGSPEGVGLWRQSSVSCRRALHLGLFPPTMQGVSHRQPPMFAGARPDFGWRFFIATSHPLVVQSAGFLPHASLCWR